MHEAGVAERILEAALARAALARACRVTIVEIEAGEDSGVSEEAVRFHWDETARGTPAEGALLRFRAVTDPTTFRLVAIEVDDAAPREGRRGPRPALSRPRGSS